jgi:hypothetical protein
MNHTGSPFVISVILVSVFVFAILSNIQAFAQQPPSLSTAGTSMPWSSTSPEQHITKIKITSPTKGQQVVVGKDLTISGISMDNATASSTDCKVSVIANKVRPYQPTTATGPGGAADYSKWNFVLTSKYTTIKPGENRITARYECANNASLTSFSSINVTGVSSAATNTTNATNSSTSTGASNPATTTTTKPNATTIAQTHAAKIPVATKARSPPVVSESAISEPKRSITLPTSSTSDQQSKQQNIRISSNDDARRSSAANATTVGPMHIPVSSQSYNKPSAATIAPQVKLIPQQNTKSLSQEHYQPAVQNQDRNISKSSTLGGRDISPTSKMGFTDTQRNESLDVLPPSQQYTDNHTRPNLLSVSILVGNDPITVGDKQILSIYVSDARSNDKVADAKIVGQVTESSGVTNKGFRLHSDYNGQAFYSWKMKQSAVAPDTYKVATTVAAPGYQEQVAAASFTVNPSMSSNTSTGKLVNGNIEADANGGELLSNRVHDFTNKILDDVKQNIKDKWTPRNFILPTPF